MAPGTGVPSVVFTIPATFVVWTGAAASCAGAERATPNAQKHSEAASSVTRHICQDFVPRSGRRIRRSLRKGKLSLGQGVALPRERRAPRIAPSTATERMAQNLAVPVRFATPDANYRITCEADRTIERGGEARIARATAPYRCSSVHGNSSAQRRPGFQKYGESGAERAALASLIRDELDCGRHAQARRR